MFWMLSQVWADWVDHGQKVRFLSIHSHGNIFFLFLFIDYPCSHGSSLSLFLIHFPLTITLIPMNLLAVNSCISTRLMPLSSISECPLTAVRHPHLHGTRHLKFRRSVVTLTIVTHKAAQPSFQTLIITNMYSVFKPQISAVSSTPLPHFACPVSCQKAKFHGFKHPQLYKSTCQLAGIQYLLTRVLSLSLTHLYTHTHTSYLLWAPNLFNHWQKMN